MATKQKYYVVWAGHDTGVFDNWEDAQLQVEGFSCARYKSFNTREAAIEAYRGGERADALAVIGAIAAHPADRQWDDPSAPPPYRLPAIAVDASCPGNPGPVEYRGVNLADGRQLFAVGPYRGGTNNIGEFLAIVHALALIDRDGLAGTVVYSDSRVAIGWVARSHAKTQITPTDDNAPLRALIARAEAWLHAHPHHAAVYKWDTAAWGEVPADYGRK